MDFKGMTIDEALRKFQMSFLLPGEAQKIERLMEVRIIMTHWIEIIKDSDPTVETSHLKLMFEYRQLKLTQ